MSAAVDHRPLMSNAACEPVAAATASDEYGQNRKLHVAQERPLTIYLNRQEIVTLMTLGTEP
ncbi:MAG: sulfurtransferase FdhD, partial [Candidatus Porifericomitaceae bacterium WSBS_2022_MAG_OTU9]